MSVLHGKLIKAQAGYGEIHIVPLYHPAVVLYSATQKVALRKDFEKLKTFVRRGLRVEQRVIDSIGYKTLGVISPHFMRSPIITNRV